MSDGKEETNIDREKDLRKSINDFFVNVMKCKDDRDYYSDLDTEKLFAMKNALKTVDNILTYKGTLEAVDEFKKIFGLEQIETHKNKIRETNSNENGYDIQIEENGKNIIAEVKCNNTFESGKKKLPRFRNSAQEGIIKDIHNLWQKKDTAELKSEIKNYFKFMILVDADGKVQEAAKALLKTRKKQFQKLKVLASKPYLNL